MSRRKLRCLTGSLLTAVEALLRERFHSVPLTFVGEWYADHKTEWRNVLQRIPEEMSVYEACTECAAHSDLNVLQPLALAMREMQYCWLDVVLDRDIPALDALLQQRLDYPCAETEEALVQSHLHARLREVKHMRQLLLDAQRILFQPLGHTRLHVIDKRAPQPRLFNVQRLQRNKRERIQALLNAQADHRSAIEQITSGRTSPVA